jgi:ABC-type multidrug transport system fused ATPase/permease subunit
MSIKREMSNTKAPLFSTFGDALGGLVSVRAYGAEQMFRDEALQRVDRYLRTAVSFYNLNRWCNVRCASPSTSSPRAPSRLTLIPSQSLACS